MRAASSANRLASAARPACPGWRAPHLLLCVLLVALAACEDVGKERYQQSFRRYQALVTEGRHPMDPAFDEVLKQLDTVPKSSAAAGKAQALHESILRSRRRLAPRPLANAPGGGADKPPAVVAKQQECVKLAEAIGAASLGEKDAALERLRQCKRELLGLEEKAHDDETPR